MHRPSWYISRFPEAYFPPITNHEEYVKYCTIGLKSFRHDILFAGIARNCGINIIYQIERMLSLCGFNDQILIYENNSTDKTRHYIESYLHTGKIKYLSEDINGYGEGKDKTLTRRINLANARNRLLDMIYSRSLMSDLPFRYIVILDLDIPGGFSYEGLFNSIGWMETHKIDVMASNGIIEQDNQLLFYDTWAYRPSDNQETDDSKYNLLKLNRGESPYKVRSAFGGMAIYKAECFDHHSLKYDSDDCDHPTLHRKLRSLGKNIYINPSQIVMYSPHYYCILKDDEDSVTT